MPTDRKQKPKPWRKRKAKIIEHFGTVTALARALDCSTEAVRQAATGTGCPDVAKRLELLLP